MRKEDFSSLTGKVIKAKQGFYAFVPVPLPPPLNWTDNLISLLSAAERELARLALS